MVNNLIVVAESELLLASKDIITINFEVGSTNSESLTVASIIGGCNFVFSNLMSVDSADWVWVVWEPVLDKTIRLNSCDQILIGVFVVSGDWIPSND